MHTSYIALHRWGVLDRLLEDNRFDVEALSGTSGGAVNAVVFVAGWIDGGALGARAAPRRPWQRIGDSAGLSPSANFHPHSDRLQWAADQVLTHIFVDVTTRLVSPYQFNPLQQILLELVDFAKLRLATAPRLVLAATNVREGRARIFGNNELDADVVSASACLPLLQPAVKIDGKPHWDGGLVTNPPILKRRKGGLSH